MTNLEAKVFNDFARYALRLAEQLQEHAVRDDLLKTGARMAGGSERC